MKRLFPIALLSAAAMTAPAQAALVSNLTESGFPAFSLLGSGSAAAFTVGPTDAGFRHVTLRLSSGLLGTFERALLGSPEPTGDSDLDSYNQGFYALSQQANAQINGVLTTFPDPLTGGTEGQAAWAQIQPILGQLAADLDSLTQDYSAGGVTPSVEQAGFASMVDEMVGLGASTSLGTAVTYAAGLFADAGGTPGSQLFPLSGVTDAFGTLADFDFVAPGGATLLAGTTYWIQASMTGGDYARWLGTASNGQVGAPGWSIADGGALTPQFGVVPAPGVASLMLLGLGVLAGRRRRHHSTCLAA
jgi:MYXO-CTERM domain-containing protein